MGKVTGLGPAAILLSLSFWGALMGVIGMIIALPLTTLGISCYKHYVLHEPFMSEQIEATKATDTSIKTPRPRKRSRKS
jgi:predicted PurR-regulated permease PerM